MVSAALSRVDADGEILPVILEPHFRDALSPVYWELRITKLGEETSSGVRRFREKTILSCVNFAVSVDAWCTPR